MLSPESVELIEGDLIYLHYLPCVKDEVNISSNKSTSAEIDNFSGRMSSSESVELIEGDLMYLDYSTYVKEEVDIDSIESTSTEIDHFSDSEISNEIEQQFEDKKEQIQMDDNQEISINSVHSCSNSSEAFTTDSENLTAKEESHPTCKENIKNHNIHQNTSQRVLIRKQRFSSKNLIDMYCCECKRVRKRVWGDKKTVCKKCKVSLKYQCTKCKKRYKTYKDVVLHVKSKCYRTSSLQCSACNYETQNKANLNAHVQSRHSLQTCSGCGEKYESNQIVKHQLYDCKSWNNPSNNGIHSKTQVLTANEIKSTTTQKLAARKCSLLLERYCKKCDKTVEKVRGINICDGCKSSLLYQCITCCNRYSTSMCAYQHLRSCIRLNEFHCSECEYKTCYRSSLTNHIENKHVLQECEVCDVICENRRSLSKHIKYECKRKK